MKPSRRIAMPGNLRWHGHCMMIDASGNYSSPCQVTEEIGDKLAEEAADNAHCVAPSDINTWSLTNGKGDTQP